MLNDQLKIKYLGFTIVLYSFVSIHVKNVGLIQSDHINNYFPVKLDSG